MGTRKGSSNICCNAFKEVTAELGPEGLAGIGQWTWAWEVVYPSSRNGGKGTKTISLDNSH